MSAIGIVHPGLMGAAIGKSLVAAGHDVLWASEGRSAATCRRAQNAGLRDAESCERLRAACDVIISVCPPEFALDVAEEFTDYRGVYVDANAVSPETSLKISRILGQSTFIDGSIIGPPPGQQERRTRLYVSGEDASTLLALAGTEGFDIVKLEGPTTAASALKMTYALWTKGTQGLLISIRAVARSLDVEQVLLSEWALSLPELEGRSRSAEERASRDGWRWAWELEEIGRCFNAHGQPSGFGAAAAEVFRTFDRPSVE